MDTKGYRCMVTQTGIRALQILDIPHTLNRWILYICLSKLLPQTLQNFNRNTNVYNKKNSHDTHPCNPEKQKIKSNIPSSTWGSLTKMSENIWRHCRLSSISTNTYNPNIINTNRANANTLRSTHTPTHQKNKHAGYNPSGNNTSR